MLKRFWNRGTKQKIILIIVGLIVICTLLILRDDYQPFLLFLRKYLFILLLFIAIIYFGIRAFRKAESAIKKIFKAILTLASIVLIYVLLWNIGMYDYLQTYNVFNDMDLQEISKLPLSRNERIQPYNNIKTMAYESISETQEVSAPQLVRVDDRNQWTMAVQPSQEYFIQRTNDNIEELFSVSSTSPSPRFSNENRIPATFAIGESLAFSRNTYNAVVQRFNPWQLFNYEPHEAYYMKNDDGNWVQVVSLIKWKGFFFPYPTFGGVMVIETGEHDFNDYLERLLIGKGTFISAEDVQKHPYLTRQNTLSEKISRLQAKSMMFLGGFTDPLPWNKKTAVKIPDLIEDQNQQPFVTDFKFTGTVNNAYDGLYHWFGLEPIGAERTGLSISVFIPADGSKTVYYYNHAARKEGLAGVSAMPAKVMESKKEYDWTVNKPVEFRPFIRDIAGKRRLFMLSTIAAKRANSNQFDGGSTPDLALVDVSYKDVVWIDAKHPSTWNEEILKQLGETWQASENLSDSELYPEKENLKTEIIKDSLTIQRDSIVRDTLNQ
ncbi:hypothetical protein IMCC3317_20750 [Kordia antarctica]|uniref:Uncharacterized protein n=1 Tax=Kordia antarctica TaxID=1218801 RepID=A0A7L4ZJJ5_9FLAO|nr:hypothetical protein [Kordia antarctica]QHI36710.1 hypothetical protein IMCC3317_20750 [Kordia antarctica]